MNLLSQTLLSTSKTRSAFTLSLHGCIEYQRNIFSFYDLSVKLCEGNSTGGNVCAYAGCQVVAIIKIHFVYCKKSYRYICYGSIDGL